MLILFQYKVEVEQIGLFFKNINENKTTLLNHSLRLVCSTYSIRNNVGKTCYIHLWSYTAKLIKLTRRKKGKFFLAIKS